MFGKKTKEPEQEIEELLPQGEDKTPKKKGKKAKEEPQEVKEEPKPQPKATGFNLNDNEMALAVNALASSEEFKLYQQMVLGQQIAGIIDNYNQVILEKKRSEEPDEQLPTK